MQLSKDELEQCVGRLFAMLEARGFVGVETADRNFYWHVLSEEWVDQRRCPEPGVGSLLEDVKHLKMLLAKEVEPSALDLERVAAILKLISDDLVT